VGLVETRTARRTAPTDHVTNVAATSALICWAPRSTDEPNAKPDQPAQRAAGGPPTASADPARAATGRLP
jgi:hypothetical protein